MTDPVALVDFLSKYGGWGLFVLALLVIRYLFLKYEASQQARIDDGKLYAGALKDAAEAIEKTNEQNVDLLAVVSSIKLMLEAPRRGRS